MWSISSFHLLLPIVTNCISISVMGTHLGLRRSLETFQGSDSLQLHQCQLSALADVQIISVYTQSAWLCFAPVIRSRGGWDGD